ncbi:transcription factor IIIC subunit delta N-term-domain-containing protein [Kockovaella imperatae]|uniref:Transcription factor IIIC subunit delta N-term-domain-containing protein n=1 Tax=Kockovaella imperatae TaxID=4999 RepID=A0A1Y1UFB3_9TREE|nr:transcription factor IIIC subunit delta N-term-domain-containing protein [Kockovaella imperatae]ORX36679.1 transcription factor IIIC subunit delta N-term-domain-containing protein [Kockovaella imperatae]
MTADHSRKAPMVLGTKVLPHMIAPSARGGVAWNQDGQCLILTKRGVVIMTPYLCTTLPGPPSHLEADLNLENPSSAVMRERRARAKAEEAMDLDSPSETPQPAFEVSAEAGLSRPRRVLKPKMGEIKWWTTSLEVDKDGNRDLYYDWIDVGDSYGGVLSGREVLARSAIWSPSGLSELGGSLIAIMTTAGQVSIYAPRTEPYSKQWDEIADLTILMKEMLDVKDVTPPIALQMKATSMAWSAAVPAVEMLGRDGSLLAMGSRAGMVALWTYGEERRFTCDAYLKVSDDAWVTQMSWSSWELTEHSKYETHLAIALSDGSIALIPIFRERHAGDAWSLSFGTMEWVDGGDRRQITALQWIESVLVWTKSSSVHLWSSREESVGWKGTKIIRLDRVGNWAGANPLGACIGIELLDPDRLLITLSALTQHVIVNFRTSPTLADPQTSLAISLAARHCVLDLQKDDAKFGKDERQLSVVTSSISGIGTPPHFLCWASEVMNLHNLDSANESVRSIIFVLADLGITSVEQEDPLAILHSILQKSPRLLHCSPLFALMPFMLRVLTMRDPMSPASGILELCENPPGTSENPSTLGQGSASAWSELMSSLWANVVLDKLRLSLVVARWSAITFPTLAPQFETLCATLNSQIQDIIATALIVWILAEVKSEALEDLSPDDRAFMGRLAALPIDDAVTSSLRTMMAGSSFNHTCPVCSAPVDTGKGGQSICANGHEWTPCCVTQSLITSPIHRLCTVCSAASLLPDCHKPYPIPVSPEGQSLDWTRFQSSDGTAPSGQPSGKRRGLQQMALEAAIVCPHPVLLIVTNLRRRRPPLFVFAGIDNASNASEDSEKFALENNPPQSDNSVQRHLPSTN